MKKSILSVAILSALVAGTASAATVYKNDTTNLNIGGRAEPRFSVSDANKDATHGSFKDKSRTRINIVGDTQLNDDLGAFGKYEAELATSSDGTINTRYLFAGLKTKAGSFSYGKQDSAQVMLTDYTDILETFGGDASDLVDGNADKLTNNFLYSTAFDALTVQANYIASDLKDNDNYGIAAQYSLPFGLNIGAGYVGGDESNNSVDQFNIAANYEINNFYVSGLAAFGSKDVAGSGSTDLNSYEFAAAYTWNKMTFQGVYNYKESKPSGSSTVKLVDYVALEGVYKYNKTLRLYAGYKLNQINNGDDDLLAGIRYDF